MVGLAARFPPGFGISLIHAPLRESERRALSAAIEFQNMNEDEFSRCKAITKEDYAESIARNTKRHIDEVRNEANAQVEGLLKNGLSTQGHYLFNVVESKTSVTIGWVWFRVEEEKQRAFLFGMMIHEPYRGKGYGRKTLELLEAKLKERKVKQIGLHVFADNQTAMNLYKKDGFYISGFNMQKDL